MASRKTAEICSCKNNHVTSNSSLDTSDSSTDQVDNVHELRHFSSLETLSEYSDLPQPLHSKSRKDLRLRVSPKKQVQTKPNLLGSASANRLNVSQVSSSQMKKDEKRTSKVTFSFCSLYIYCKESTFPLRYGTFRSVLPNGL